METQITPAELVPLQELVRQTGTDPVNQSSGRRPFVVRVYGIGEPETFKGRQEYKQFAAVLEWEFESDAGVPTRDLEVLRRVCRDLHYVIGREVVRPTRLDDGRVWVAVRAIYRN